MKNNNSQGSTHNNFVSEGIRLCASGDQLTFSPQAETKTRASLIFADFLRLALEHKITT